MNLGTIYFISYISPECFVFFKYKRHKHWYYLSYHCISALKLNNAEVSALLPLPHLRLMLNFYIIHKTLTIKEIF